MSNPPERLEEFIKSQFKSKTEAATALGISFSALDKYIGQGEKKSVFGPKYRKILQSLGLSIGWYLSGEGEMLLSGQSADTMPTINNIQKGVPYYPIDVTASIVESFNDIPEEPEFFVDFLPFNDCNAYFPVLGQSMYPKYQSGDLVAVKQIFNFNVLLWGETYLVITNAEANNLKTIKDIHPCLYDVDSIILRAVNPAYGGDVVIPKQSILHMFIIKGKITRYMY